MKTVKWIVINGIFAVLLWLGLARGMEGANNVAMFYAWLSGIVGFLASLDVATKSLTEVLTERAVPKWVDGTFDMLVVGFFVWHGYWWTAGVFFLGAVSMETARRKVQKLLEQPALSVTKEQLLGAMSEWEQNFRAGRTRTVQECMAMEPDAVAKESADYLWQRLGGEVPA